MRMIKITFLGTGCMTPTKERNVSAIAINYKSELILIDCGEGTQRQIKFAKLKPNKISKIFISHWHGDHVLGLGGLIRTLGSNNYNKELEIYGPVGTKKYFTNLMNACIFNEKIKVKIKEIESGICFENKDYIIDCLPLNHSCPCIGFSFIEKDKRKIKLDYTKKFGLEQHPLLGELQKGKDITYNNKKIKVKNATELIPGKKITVLLDTEECLNAIRLAKNSDLLISEGTFMEKEKNQAKEAKHLTIKQAVSIAKKSKVKELIITHLSQRYKSEKELLKETKEFKKTKIAKDFMEIEI